MVQMVDAFGGLSGAEKIFIRDNGAGRGLFGFIGGMGFRPTRPTFSNPSVSPGLNGDQRLLEQ